MASEKFRFKHIVLYSIGQLGWSILMGLINTYLIWFYLPPANANLPELLPQGQILGFLTIIGLITMGGRLLDAVTDPLVATLSDRSNSKIGRRISFMKAGAIPLALFTILVFWAPFSGNHIINIIALTLSLAGFYIFYTVYVTPYFALISELGHTPEARLNISTAISVTFFIGTGIAFGAPALWNILVSAGIVKVMAVRYVVLGMAALALILMFVPVFTINEKKFSSGKPSKENVIDSMKKTFANYDFKVFVVSDLAYWLALTVLQTGLIYYVTVLLELPEEKVSFYNIMVFAISFLFYPFVNILGKKLGKKKLMLIAFSIFSIMYFYIFFLGKNFMPFNTNIQAIILVVLAALPLAIFGILPNAIIADVAESDAIITGSKREAMFFGARTFMSKIGQMLAMLLFSSLLLLGKDIGNDLGIRLTGPAAGIFCLVGLAFFALYREKFILNSMKNKQKETDEITEIKE
ncbi:MAG: MFS transporter [Bacteroidales bacterium]|nr:MFS transporter [Bacteroidales bacterium]